MVYEELNKYRDVPVLEGEIWKPINNWEGLYEISNYGRVKRLAFSRTNRNQITEWEQFYPENIYSLSGNTQGYPQVTLTAEGRDRQVSRCHRLVAEHFLQPPTKGLIKECKLAGLDYVPVEHEDDNPRNPHVNNLRWCSTSFNNRKASQYIDYSGISGSNQVKSKLTEEDVDEILNLIDKGCSQQEIADKFNVKQITISNIKTGRSWSHYTGILKKARTRKRKPKALMERKEK